MVVALLRSAVAASLRVSGRADSAMLRGCLRDCGGRRFGRLGCTDRSSLLGPHIDCTAGFDLVSLSEN